VTRPAFGATVALLVVLAATAIVMVGRPLTARLRANADCCQIPIARNLRVSATELWGTAFYPSEIGQDKWVLETVFPDVTNGYFVDVGSGHGTIGSNTAALERRGWTGICIDPFPVHMEGRTCQLYREVVFDTAGQRMTFRAAGGLGGLADTLGKWNDKAARAPAVEFTTVTLGDILVRAHAPAFIHFISLDIEGAELAALQGFPFDRVRVGAFAIEHNEEEPKRSQIKAFLEQRGYVRTHTYKQDDFYTAAAR
jgi:hypothetical protein